MPANPEADARYPTDRTSETTLDAFFKRGLAQVNWSQLPYRVSFGIMWHGEAVRRHMKYSNTVDLRTLNSHWAAVASER